MDKRFPDFSSAPKEFEDLIDHQLQVVRFKKVDNNKDSKFYILFEFVDLTDKKMVTSRNGSEEIKLAYQTWIEEKKVCPFPVTIKKYPNGKRNRYYFAEYHTSDEEKFEYYMNMINSGVALGSEVTDDHV